VLQVVHCFTTERDLEPNIVARLLSSLFQGLIPHTFSP